MAQIIGRGVNRAGRSGIGVIEAGEGTGRDEHGARRTDEAGKGASVADRLNWQGQKEARFL